MKPKILLSGSSGFLGKEIYEELKSDFEICTMSRTNAMLPLDLDSENFNLPARFSIVIHAAGKAHVVPRSGQQAQSFFNVNVKGTANLLAAIERAGLPEVFVFISSVSVYGRSEGRLISEDEPLMASDPYGKSKVECENLLRVWADEKNVRLVIFRLPLVAAPNPPGNLGAMIRGIKKGYYFSIAGSNPQKSMVMASDIARIIPAALNVPGIYNLTDGYHPTFSELSKVIALQAGAPTPPIMPLYLAKFFAKVGDLLGSAAPLNSNKLEKMRSELTFDDSKARKLLNWQPKSVLEHFKITS